MHSDSREKKIENRKLSNMIILALAMVNRMETVMTNYLPHKQPLDVPIGPKRNNTKTAMS